MLSLAGAGLWLGLAACSGTAAAPPAPQALGTPDVSSADTSGAWEALSQSSRVAPASAAGTGAVAAPELMSPDEIRAAAPFAFEVPAWAPPGFQLQAQAELIGASNQDGFASVTLNWQDAQGAAIALAISRGEAGSALAGAGGDSESIQIGGQPASLRHQAGFGADRLMLSWTRGSLTYRLAAEAGAATRDDLVRMAESVP